MCGYSEGDEKRYNTGVSRKEHELCDVVFVLLEADSKPAPFGEPNSEGCGTRRSRASFGLNAAREDEMRRVNFRSGLKWTLNPHPSMNQVPKGAAPEVVLVSYELPENKKANAPVAARIFRSRRCG